MTSAPIGKTKIFFWKYFVGKEMGQIHFYEVVYNKTHHFCFNNKDQDKTDEMLNKNLRNPRNQEVR